RPSNATTACSEAGASRGAAMDHPLTSAGRVSMGTLPTGWGGAVRAASPLQPTSVSAKLATRSILMAMAAGSLIALGQQLEPVTIGIVEVDAVRVALAAVDLDAGPFERGLHFLVMSRGESQRHVVDLQAGPHVVAVCREQRHHLASATQEGLTFPAVCPGHAQEVHVELLRPVDIAHVQHHMVDAAHFQSHVCTSVRF